MGLSGIERRLLAKIEEALPELRNVRTPAVNNGVFFKRYYISPQDLRITNYLRTQPAAAFNPGAAKRDGELIIFPRLVFDYYSYNSSIGVFYLEIDEVVKGRIFAPIETKIVLWPKNIWEFGHGCEDPRVTFVRQNIYMLYTGSQHYHVRGQLVKKSVLGFAELSSALDVKRRGYFTVTGGEERVALSNKDSAFIEVEGSEATVLTRPDIKGNTLCWRASADLDSLVIPEHSLEPVIAPEEWEEKVGWSTNTVRLSDNEYLVGWHAVLKENLAYQDGLAVVDRNGKLLATSDYLLAPQGLKEQYGDRTSVIFGDGLVEHNGYLIWVGGISDYGIGIFIAKLDAALATLKSVRQR